jgi:hypothetical protein
VILVFCFLSSPCSGARSQGFRANFKGVHSRLAVELQGCLTVPRQSPCHVALILLHRQRSTPHARLLVDMESGPAFPPGLECEIFETAAVVHPATIPVLLQVAKRVLLWSVFSALASHESDSVYGLRRIEPYMYRVISMHHDNRAMVTAVLEAMKLKPPEFFRKAVRHLAIGEGAYSMKDARQLLQLCTGSSILRSTTTSQARSSFHLSQTCASRGWP